MGGTGLSMVDLGQWGLGGCLWSGRWGVGVDRGVPGVWTCLADGDLTSQAGVTVWTPPAEQPAAGAALQRAGPPAGPADPQPAQQPHLLRGSAPPACGAKVAAAPPRPRPGLWAALRHFPEMPSAEQGGTWARGAVASEWGRGGAPGAREPPSSPVASPLPAQACPTRPSSPSPSCSTSTWPTTR